MFLGNNFVEFVAKFLHGLFADYAADRQSARLESAFDSPPVGVNSVLCRAGPSSGWTHKLGVIND